MIHFFRKIRQQLIDNKRFKTYLTYAIGEIVLVVIGILIAISLNNLKDASDLEKEEIDLYKDMITELEEDLRDIRGNMEYNNHFLERYRRATEIILNDQERVLKDSLAVIATELTQFSDFKNESAIYDRLFTSGEQSLVSDKEIIGDLKRLAVMYNYVNRLERNHQDFMYSVLPKIADYIRFNPPEIKKPEELYGYRFHNDIEIYIFIMEEKRQLYENVEAEISSLLDRLNEKIK